MKLAGRPPRGLLILMFVLTQFLLWPSMGRAQGPPIQTDTPIMLGLEGRGFRTFVKVTRKHKLLLDGNEILDPMNRSATVYAYPLAVPYNLTTTTQVGVVAPLLSKRIESKASEASRSGFGDATVFVKQLILRIDRKGETFRVAVKGSAKLPTGDEGGAIPLGSGSFDYGGNAVAGWVAGRWGLYGEMLYHLNGTSGGIDFGDRFGYNVAAGFRLLPTIYERYPQPQLNFYLELNGSVVGHNEAQGVENPDSGGSIIFISPGVQYVGGRRWLIEASFQFPMIDEPNGIQLATNWAASIGTRILVF